MKIYSIGVNEIQSLCNDAKDFLLEALVRDGVIPEDATTENLIQDLCLNYHIIVYEKGMLGKFWDIIQGKSDQVKMLVVRSSFDKRKK